MAEVQAVWESNMLTGLVKEKTELLARYDSDAEVSHNCMQVLSLRQRLVCTGSVDTAAFAEGLTCQRCRHPGGQEPQLEAPEGF